MEIIFPQKCVVLYPWSQRYFENFLKIIFVSQMDNLSESIASLIFIGFIKALFRFILYTLSLITIFFPNPYSIFMVFNFVAGYIYLHAKPLLRYKCLFGTFVPCCQTKEATRSCKIEHSHFHWTMDVFIHMCVFRSLSCVVLVEYSSG